MCNWFHHAKQKVRQIILERPPVQKVLKRDGNFFVNVPEESFPGSFDDYSIDSLLKANIPIEKVNQPITISEDDAQQIINSLPNTK